MRMLGWWSSWAVWMLSALLVGGGGGDGGPRRCQEITVPMCRGIGYNLTYMPNAFSHDTQEEAGLEVHQFWPLVEIQCSRDLRLFLCSMYAPICVPNYHKPLPACKSLCERVRRGCEPLMIQYGFAWPQHMSCEGLPEYGDRHRLCMDFNASSASASTSSHLSPRQSGKATTTPPARGPGRGSGGGNCSCGCPAPLVHVTDPKSRLYDVAKTGDQHRCALPCDGIYFGEAERSFMRLWIGVWASVCLVSTSATVLTFAVDRSRFRYPERAIVCLSACYAVVALGYIVRLAAGNEAVSCESLDDGGDTRVIRYATTGPPACTAVFLLIYYFSMASCLWWVVLTFTWFLAAGLKWGQEAIGARAHYLHLVAWVVPAVQSAVALALSAVDGDAVAGICHIGNQDSANLRGFVLAPLSAYLIFGSCFLVAGFVAMFRVRNHLNSSTVWPAGTEKLDRFMIRIGVVSVLYIVPASTLIACLVYEQAYRETWEHDFICSACSSRSSSRDPSTEHGGSGSARPDLSVFALKHLSCLAVGITSGFWVWTRKTLESWCRCGCHQLCQCGGPGGAVAARAAVDKTGVRGGAKMMLPPVGACVRPTSSSAPATFSSVQRCKPSLTFLQTVPLNVDDCKTPSIYSRV